MRVTPVVLRALRASLASVACHRHQVSVAMHGDDDTHHLDVGHGNTRGSGSCDLVCTQVTKVKMESIRSPFHGMGQVVAQTRSKYRNRIHSSWLVADKVSKPTVWHKTQVQMGS